MLADTAGKVLSLKLILCCKRSSAIFTAISRSFVEHLLYYGPVLTTCLAPDNYLSIQQNHMHRHYTALWCLHKIKPTANIRQGCVMDIRLCWQFFHGRTFQQVSMQPVDGFSVAGQGQRKFERFSCQFTVKVHHIILNIHTANNSMTVTDIKSKKHNSNWLRFGRPVVGTVPLIR